VLVGGGATGIGAAVVQAFRRRGDAVLLADVNQQAATRTLQPDLPGRRGFSPVILPTPPPVMRR